MLSWPRTAHDGRSLRRSGGHTVGCRRRKRQRLHLRQGKARPEQWTASRIRAWGELLGRLQAHSRPWEAPGPRRPHLWEQSYLTRLDCGSTGRSPDRARPGPAHQIAGRRLEWAPRPTGAVPAGTDNKRTRALERGGHREILSGV